MTNVAFTAIANVILLQILKIPHASVFETRSISAIKQALNTMKSRHSLVYAYRFLTISVKKVVHVIK